MRIGEDETGFTVIEVVVTLVLSMLFLVFFTQMFQAITAQQLSVARQSSANNVAFSNLSKFPTINSISEVGTAYACGNTNDLSTDPDASGTLILSDSSSFRETNLQNLPEANQVVRAYSPLGCGHNLVKLVSRVTYGFEGQRGEAVYATYIKN